MEAGLMEIVRSLNRSWIYDTYFSLYRAIHPGEFGGGEMSGYLVKPMGFSLSCRYDICLVFQTIKSVCLLPVMDLDLRVCALIISSLFQYYRIFPHFRRY